MGRFAMAPGRRIQRFTQKVGQLVYASGATSLVNLPQSDYVASLDLIAAQTVTTGATAPVIAGYGAFGPLAQVQITTNGQRRPISLSGYALDVYNRIRAPLYRGDLTASPVPISSVPAWVNHLNIPLTVSGSRDVDEARDNTDNTELAGVWYTGDTALTMSLKVTFGTAAQTFSTVNGATIQGSWDVYRETFNAPAPDQAGGLLSQISWYHEVLQQTTTQLRNGTTQVVLPTDTDYERIILLFYTGSNGDGTFAPADGLYTSLDLVLNDKIHVVENVSEAKVRFDMDRNYRMMPPVGTAVLDFVSSASGIGGALHRRDVLPTDPAQAQTLKLNITSTNGAAYVDVITDSVADSPFAARWIAQAAAAVGHGKAA